MPVGTRQQLVIHWMRQHLHLRALLPRGQCSGSVCASPPPTPSRPPPPRPSPPPPFVVGAFSVSGSFRVVGPTLASLNLVAVILAISVKAGVPTSSVHVSAAASRRRAMLQSAVTVSYTVNMPSPAAAAAAVASLSAISAPDLQSAGVLGLTAMEVGPVLKLVSKLPPPFRVRPQPPRSSPPPPPRPRPPPPRSPPSTPHGSASVLSPPPARKKKNQG